MNELEILKREIEELKAWKRSMERSSTIPLPVDQAVRERFPFLQKSAKSSTSEDINIDEAGAQEWTVLANPDGFFKVNVFGVGTKQIPYFN